jgi:hypothetical protein
VTLDQDRVWQSLEGRLLVQWTGQSWGMRLFVRHSVRMLGSTG